MKSTIVRAIGLVCILVLALGLSACSDDGGGGGGTAAGPDPERYCELVAELEEAGSAAFDEIQADEEATQEDFQAASKQFTEDSKEEFDELVAVAPTEIKEDVETLVGAIRAQAEGDASAQEEASGAETNITAWEEENC